MSSPHPPSSRGSTELSAFVKGVLVLGVVVLACTGLVRACSFAPGGPEVDRSALRPVDATRALTDAAGRTGFPVRVPAVPADWVAQSSDAAPLAGTADRAVRVGWLTPDDRFVRLVQTAGSEATAVRSEQGDPGPRGTVQAGGRPWVVHAGVRDEPVWVTEVDGVRLLVTGDARPEALTTLAAAAVNGRVVGG
jgi:hypothetical protein